MKQFFNKFRGQIKRRVDALVIRFRRLPDMNCSVCNRPFEKRSKALVMGGCIVHATAECAWNKAKFDQRKYSNIPAIPYRKAVLQVLQIEAQEHRYEKSLFHG